jgi:hypothetical protein
MFTLHELIEMIKKIMVKGFYGKLQFNVEDGKITYIKEEKTYKKITE